MALWLGVAAFVVVVAAFLVWRRLVHYRRVEYIRTFTFPRGLFDKLKRQRPELTRKDASLVARGLRQFFLAYLNGGRRHVSMPSQVADDLWHEFILYTRNYERFCRLAFGGFLHHTPAAVLAPDQRDSNAGLRRVWWQCCREENIDPRKATRLPLLFALDAKLAIAGGFVYAADCAALRAGGRGDIFCGGDFSDTSVDGGTSGLGEGAGDGGGDGDGSSDGGCGGGGCGGGGGD